MALVTLGATRLDENVACWAAKAAQPRLEKALKAATLAADERVLLVVAGGLWLASRAAQPELRGKADYLAANVVASVVLPHIIKRLVDQRRPDRTIHGRRHGIPKSGKAKDAFPSGHAVHVGAMAGAVSREFPRAAAAAWGASLFLSGTRVLLLAHWLTDVLAGLALGAAQERLIHRLWRRAKTREVLR